MPHILLCYTPTASQSCIRSNSQEHFKLSLFFIAFHPLPTILWSYELLLHLLISASQRIKLLGFFLRLRTSQIICSLVFQLQVSLVTKILLQFKQGHYINFITCHSWTVWCHLSPLTMCCSKYFSLPFPLHSTNLPHSYINASSYEFTPRSVKLCVGNTLFQIRHIPWRTSFITRLKVEIWNLTMYYTKTRTYGQSTYDQQQAACYISGPTMVPTILSICYAPFTPHSALHSH